MTVADNVAYGLKVTSIPKAESAPKLGARQPCALGHSLELGPNDGGMDFWIGAGL